MHRIAPSGRIILNDESLNNGEQRNHYLFQNLPGSTAENDRAYGSDQSSPGQE